MIRFLLSLLAAALLALGLVGVLAEQSLSAPAEFAAQMRSSLQDPAVNAEVKQSVREQAGEAIRSAGAAGGLLGSLAAGLAADTLAEQAAQVVDTPAFADAYAQWAQVLHQGLADYARGKPTDSVVVAGSTMTVAIEPLIAPIVGSAAAGAAADALRSAGVGATLTFDTGVDLRGLRVLGMLAEQAWWLVAAGAGALLLVVAAGPDRMRWLGIALLVCAAAAAGLAALVWWLQSAPLPQADYPNVGRAVVASLTARWMPMAATVAAGCAVLGTILLLVGGSGRRGRRVAHPTFPQ